MKQRESWIVMLGYPNVSLQAKRLYWLMDRVADEDWVVITTNVALAKLTGKGVEMIGRYLQNLRVAGLLETLEVGRGRKPSRYHLLPPNPKNIDYKRAVRILKHASQLLTSGDKVGTEVQLQSKIIGRGTTTLSSTTPAVEDLLTKGSGLNSKDKKWLLHHISQQGIKSLRKYIKEDPKERTKPISDWSTWDFVRFSRWLYEKAFNKPCLVLDIGRGSQAQTTGKVLSRFKTELVGKFKKHRMTKAHAVAYLTWLFQEKKKDIRVFHALVGIICSSSYQQEWIEWELDEDDDEETNKYLGTLFCMQVEDSTSRPWEQYWDEKSSACMLCPVNATCKEEASK